MYKLGTIKNGFRLVNNGNLPRLPQDSRPDGVHISGILSKIHGYSDDIIPETDNTRREFNETNLMILGKMFEFALIHWYSIAYPGRYLAPPELTSIYKDGVWLTPDLYDIHIDAYVEIKLTTKSAKACPGDKRFAMWEDQLMSYCAADNCHAGRLHVCHVNGLYKWLDKRATPAEIANDDTVFNVWHRDYTDFELMTHWARILAHKDA